MVFSYLSKQVKSQEIAGRHVRNRPRSCISLNYEVFRVPVRRSGAFPRYPVMAKCQQQAMPRTGQTWKQMLSGFANCMNPALAEFRHTSFGGRKRRTTPLTSLRKRSKSHGENSLRFLEVTSRFFGYMALQ